MENSATESPMCCCVDVGTILDGKDCTVNIQQHYASLADAEAALAYFTAKAKAAESEPCERQSAIQAVENGAELTACFTFSCQAEAMIFQLSTRSGA